MAEGTSTAYRPSGFCRMLVEQVIKGVMLENMYALTAQGYTLVFGLLELVEFCPWRNLHAGRICLPREL